MRRATTSTDISTLFKLGGNNLRVVAFLVSFASFGGNEWQHCGIDWVIEGVRKSAGKFGIAIDVTSVIEFCVTKPTLFITFCVGHSAASPAAGGSAITENTSMPASWSVNYTWDVHRPKEPTSISQRFNRITPFLVAAVQHMNLTSALVREPGGFFVLPAMQPLVPNLVHLVANDGVEAHDSMHRGFDARCWPAVDPSKFEALLILGGSLTAWYDMQSSIVFEWARKPFQGVRLLAVLVDAMQKKFYDAFFKGLHDTFSSVPVPHALDVTADIFSARGISCLLCTCFVGAGAENARNAWSKMQARTSHGLFRIES